MDYKRKLKEGLFTFATLCFMYILNILTQDIFYTKTLIPTLFVLGVFLISLKTQGYFWGVTGSLLSVLAVNYAFTYPYYAIDLISPECVASAIIMLVVAIMTSTLTTKVKLQEKIKTETEKERMRANLLRAISHDLRTPLTTIYGSCSAILENYNTLTTKQKQTLLSEIQQDSMWLIRMVENLLSITRIDGKKVQLSKVPTVLEELIDTVLIKFHKHYPEQQVDIEIPDDFISIPMDAMLIEQVLINLLENAVVHAKDMTKLALTVTIENNQARFHVYDNGCGISPDKLDKLFTGYFDTEQNLIDGKRNNMGIGLSVCSAIIKAHGGDIFVKNNKEGGASFYFTLNLS